MNRAVVTFLFAVLVAAAEIFIETMKKSKKRVSEHPSGPARGRGVNTAAAMKKSKTNGNSDGLHRDHCGGPADDLRGAGHSSDVWRGLIRACPSTGALNLWIKQRTKKGGSR